MRHSWLSVGLGVALGMATTSGHATTIYTYTGNNFDTFLNGTPPAGSYDGTMSVSGFFEVATPLAANLSNVDIAASVLSFSFTDGRQTITDTSAVGTPSFDSFSTDGSGNITQWRVNLFNSLVALNLETVTTQKSAAGEVDSGLIQESGKIDEGRRDNSAGTWTAMTVPEPTTIFLLATGLAALAWRGRRGGERVGR